MLADILVLIVTWTKTADIWKASRTYTEFKPTLSVLILRDGEWKLLVYHTAVRIYHVFRYPLLLVRPLLHGKTSR